MPKWSLLLGVVLLLGAFRPIAHADETSHRQAVAELFRLANMESLMNQNMETMFKAQVEVNPALAPFEETFKAFFGKYMSWQSLEEEFAKIYMRSFSEAEIRQLIGFYRTPVGAKSLRLMPSLMQEGAQIGAQRVQSHLPELMEAIQRDQASQTSGRP